jgi:heptosyltransferase-3
VSRGKILVIRGGAIGDFILTLPALAALRKQFPQTHLEVLGYPHVASLAQLAGVADAVRSIEARATAGFFARRGLLDAALGEYFASFSIILSYLYDPDGIFRDNVARVSKAQFIHGPHRPKETEPEHATEVFLKPLQRLAIFDAEPSPRLRLEIKSQAGAAPLLAVHPGSGSETKNWPEVRWAELLKRIAAETDWTVLLVGGEAEGERLQRLSSLIPIERLQVALHQPLPELAGRLARGRAFLGHDSGITHLAAAVGLPGVALWGETNAGIWRPRSEVFELLRAEQGLARLEVERVFQAVSRLMN